MNKEKLAFVGTGMIGAGLAVNAMMHGYSTILYDVADLEAVKTRVKGILASLVDAGACTQEEADTAYGFSSYTNNLTEAVTDAAFVQECIPERLDLKQATYKQIQEIAGNSIIIASSTTALMPSDLQAGAMYPEKILVGHPYNPSYLLPLIEICAGKETNEETVAATKAIYAGMGKVPVICNKEIFGYLAQHVNWGIRDVAVKLVADGIANAEDVDKAIMYGPGMRFPITGQLLTLALGVEGGWKELPRKYKGEEPTEFDLLLDAQINEGLANRPAENGNTVDSVLKFRDKMLVEMLRVQNML